MHRKKENTIIENANKEAEIRKQQIISDAKLNSKRKILEAREELVAAAFKRPLKSSGKLHLVSQKITYNPSLI